MTTAAYTNAGKTHADFKFDGEVGSVGVHFDGNGAVIGVGQMPDRARVWIAGGSVPTDFVPPPDPPITLPLWLVLQRLDTEGMWEVYADYMEAVTARRRAFRRYMFGQRPIQINGNGFITTLQGAGLTAPQIARVTAPPPSP